MKAVRIAAAGIVQPIALAADPAIRLRQLQNDVDGSISAVRLRGFTMVAGAESGLGQRPVPNPVATLVAGAYSDPGGDPGVVFGPVVLMGTGEGRDLPPFVDEYLALVSRKPAREPRGGSDG